MPLLLAIVLAILPLSCITSPEPETRIRTLGNSLSVTTCEDGLLCLQDIEKSKQRLDRLKSKLITWEEAEAQRVYPEGNFEKNGKQTFIIPFADTPTLEFRLDPAPNSIRDDQREGIRESIYLIRRAAFVVSELFPDNKEITVQRIFDKNKRDHQKGDCADLSNLVAGSGADSDADVSLEKMFWFIYGFYVNAPIKAATRSNTYSAYASEIQHYARMLFEAKLITLEELGQINGSWGKDRTLAHDNHLHLCSSGGTVFF